MMRIFPSFNKSLFFAAFFLFPFVLHAQEVKVAGTMRAIMQGADFSTKAQLESFHPKDLYALGPLRGLHGEFMVINGEVYASILDGDSLFHSRERAVDAAMMVYSYVPVWKTLDTLITLANVAALDTLLASLSRRAGIDTAFPFMLELRASGRMHVIGWKEGVEHTPENHRQFARNIRLEEEKISLLGFYSTRHHGIFTHHSSNLHAHVLKWDGTVGHLDALRSNGRVRIMLPAALF